MSDSEDFGVGFSKDFFQDMVARNIMHVLRYDFGCTCEPDIIFNNTDVVEFDDERGYGYTDIEVVHEEHCEMDREAEQAKLN